MIVTSATVATANNRSIRKDCAGCRWSFQCPVEQAERRVYCAACEGACGAVLMKGDPMARRPIPDLPLVHLWREAGVSFRGIGRRLAEKHLRRVAFEANSVARARAYRKWQDETGHRRDPSTLDMRHRENRARKGGNG